MEQQPVPYQRIIFACTNHKEEGKASCGARGSVPLVDALKTAVQERGLKGRIRVVATGCLGKCAFGPNMMIFPEGIWVSGVSEEALPEMMERYLREDGP